MQVSAVFESLFLHLSLEERAGGQGKSVKNKQTLGWQQWKMREKKKHSVDAILVLSFLPIYLPN